MSGAHLVSALLMRATRAHMRATTEGHDARYWAGARDNLLSQAGVVSGHTRAQLQTHVEALASNYVGEDMETALASLRAAELHALDAGGLRG